MKLGLLVMKVKQLQRLGALPILLVLGACSQSGATNNAGAGNFSGLPVRIANVTSGTVEDSSDYVANTNSRASITLQPRASGQVAQIFVQSGDRVEAGTPILAIDPSKQQAAVTSKIAAMESAEAALEEARADLANAEDQLKSLQAKKQSNISTLANNRRNLERDRQLVGEGAINQRIFDDTATKVATSQADLDAIDADIRAQRSLIARARAAIARNQRLLQQSKADVQEQKVQLDFFTIRAPFTGTVGDIPTKVGDFVSESTKLLTLSQNDRLEIQIAVPLEKASQLKTGLPVRLLEDQDKHKANGKISFVAPNVDNSTQSILVKAVFDNPKNSMRTDQFVKARLVWSSRPGVLVPTTAISRLGGQNFIFVAENKADTSGQAQLIASQRPIKLGKIVGNNQEVLEGLKPGDKIVTSGILQLRDGTPIVSAPDKDNSKEGSSSKPETKS
jgi:RND family efflux transporter MFP subunit